MLVLHTYEIDMSENWAKSCIKIREAWPRLRQLAWLRDPEVINLLYEFNGDIVLEFGMLQTVDGIEFSYDELGGGIKTLLVSMHRSDVMCNFNNCGPNLIPFIMRMSNYHNMRGYITYPLYIKKEYHNTPCDIVVVYEDGSEKYCKTGLELNYALLERRGDSND